MKLNNEFNLGKKYIEFQLFQLMTGNDLFIRKTFELTIMVHLLENYFSSKEWMSTIF